MKTLAVDMGHTVVSKADGQRIVAFGLGACVGVCLHDPVARVSGMVHVVLPKTLYASPRISPNSEPLLLGKFADTAIANLVADCLRAGANASRLQCAIAGGASVFQSIGQTQPDPPGKLQTRLGSRLEIGRRNVEAVRESCTEHGLTIAAEDVGGTWGRTLTVIAGTGLVLVRAVGSEDRLLANLGKASVPGPSPLSKGVFNV